MLHAATPTDFTVLRGLSTFVGEQLCRLVRRVSGIYRGGLQYPSPAIVRVLDIPLGICRVLPR